MKKATLVFVTMILLVSLTAGLVACEEDIPMVVNRPVIIRNVKDLSTIFFVKDCIFPPNDEGISKIEASSTWWRIYSDEGTILNPSSLHEASVMLEINKIPTDFWISTPKNFNSSNYDDIEPDIIHGVDVFTFIVDCAPYVRVAFNYNDVTYSFERWGKDSDFGYSTKLKKIYAQGIRDYIATFIKYE